MRMVALGAVGSAGLGIGCRHGPVTPTATAQTVEFAEVAPGDPSLFLEGFFPIGVFAQPAESFAKWKARGVNTLLEVPQNHDAAAWDRAAREANLRVMRRPASDPKSDIGRKDLLAWTHWDEPDAAGRIAEWTPMFERTYAEWKRLDPNRKIFINFAGPDLSWFTTRDDAYSKNYAAHYPRLLATADWIGNDLYPCGGWLNQAHAGRRGDITLLGEPLAILKRMTDKPLFAFIEASEVEKGNVKGARCPTVAEFTAQIWYALTKGVRGLFYFPAVVGKGGFRFDGSPPEIVEAMTRQNAILAKIAPLLQAEIDPRGFEAQGPPSLACGWRKHGDTALYILVNTTRRPVAATVRLQGLEKVRAGRSLTAGTSVALSNGVYTESFEPLGVRVLQFSLR